ncbi:MAG: hypothetical protein QOF19_2374 [Alphaproteobacteria bacterium]|jgi:hypothetical protein|nr:hypothetical protein [Alphaproteobacteria bacterium]
MQPGLDAQDAVVKLGRIAASAFPLSGLDCEVDTVADLSWDQLANEFEDLNYDQIGCYSAGQWGKRISHLLLRQQGVPVAGARTAIITLPGFKRGLAFLRFGPFWRRRDGAADLAVYRAAIAALVEEYCVRRGHCLTVIPRPNPEFYQQERQVLSDFGFSVRRAFPDPNRYLIDLSLDEDAQMRSFEQKWRYNLRQALAHEFEIRLCESDADVRAFQSLHATMVTRKGFYNHDMVHLLPELAAQLPEGLRPRIALAFHQGRPVGGAAIALLGDTAYYVFGGSDSAALSLKGGYALQWWIIRWLSSQNVRWYDLGGEAQEPGLRQFKKGLVGKRGAVVTMAGEYDFWTQTSGRLMADAIYGIRGAQRIMRSWR